MKNDLKSAYEEIGNVLNKYKSIIRFDFNKFENDSKVHLFELELKEKYGLDVGGKINSLDWNRFDDYRTIGIFGKEYRRTISWPDDGKQPKNEYLFEISFPTGAYTFGDDYPVDLFRSFWDELKSYGPKYTDTHNNNLYFTLKNSAVIFNNFRKILQKYSDIYRSEVNKRKIEVMKAEIAKLEEGELAPPTDKVSEGRI